MIKQYSEAITIDEGGTFNCEQAYSFDENNNSWIHIKINKDHPNSNKTPYRGRSYLKSASNDYKVTSSPDFGDCISIRINPDIFNAANTHGYEIYASRVELMNVKISDQQQFTFREAEKIYFNIKDDDDLNDETFNRLKSMMNGFYQLATRLRSRRVGLATLRDRELLHVDRPQLALFDSYINFDSKVVIAEFSIFANQILNQFVIQNRLPGLNYVQLYINELSERGRERLPTFIAEIEQKSVYFYFQMCEKIFLLKERHLINENHVASKKPSDQETRIVLPAYRILSLILAEMMRAQNDNKFSLVRALYEELRKICLKKSLFPEFVYYVRKFIADIEPEKARARLIPIDNLAQNPDPMENYYNFQLNANFYNQNLTKADSDRYGFLTLIYNQLSNPQNLDGNFNILGQINSDGERQVNELSRKELKYKSKKQKKKEQATNRSIEYNQYLEYSVVAEDVRDNNRDRIFKLKFPLYLSYYSVPFSRALNISKLFNKFLADNKGKYRIEIYLSDNRSLDERENEIFVSGNNWTRSIRTDEYLAMQDLNQDFRIDLQVLTRLNAAMQTEIERTDDENRQKEAELTLNSKLVVEFDLSKELTDNGLVLLVQFCVENRYDPGIGNVVELIHDHNKFYDNEHREFSDDPEPPDNNKPHLQLIKLHHLFHFCIGHHRPNADRKVFMIRNVTLQYNEGNNDFLAYLKPTKWLNTFKNRENICLSYYKVNTRLENDEHLVIDGEYICLYHGRMTQPNIEGLSIKEENNKRIQFELDMDDFERFKLETFNDRSNFILEFF